MILVFSLLSTQRIGQLKGRVSLDTVRAVEFVEDGAFKLAHTFQVNIVILKLSSCLLLENVTDMCIVKQ